MYTSIELFLADWKRESANTARMMGALTDASLAREVADGYRTLARIAWHVVTVLPKMTIRTGLRMSSVSETAPVPAAAADIASAYERAAKELAELVESQWTDETLKAEDDVFGQKRARGDTLAVLIRHEIHHRGQMAVLLRQAGLAVPGIYGPAREDWTQWGAVPPEV